MRSRNWYPTFQEKRDEMNARPLEHVKARGRARYRLEEWKERHFDQRHAAMIHQKREPFFYMSRKMAEKVALFSWGGQQ